MFWVVDPLWRLWLRPTSCVLLTQCIGLWGRKALNTIGLLNPSSSGWEKPVWAETLGLCSPACQAQPRGAGHDRPRKDMVAWGLRDSDKEACAGSCSFQRFPSLFFWVRSFKLNKSEPMIDKSGFSQITEGSGRGRATPAQGCLGRPCCASPGKTQEGVNPLGAPCCPCLEGRPRQSTALPPTAAPSSLHSSCDFSVTSSPFLFISKYLGKPSADCHPLALCQPGAPLSSQSSRLFGLRPHALRPFSLIVNCGKTHTTQNLPS